jgi:SOS-response transcriptional repressor LexA
LKIENDTMVSPTGHTKSFHISDIIIVNPESTAKHGDFVVAILPGAKEATFKQFVVDGGVKYLRPLNSQYPILKMDSRTRVCGVMSCYISV